MILLSEFRGAFWTHTSLCCFVKEGDLIHHVQRTWVQDLPIAGVGGYSFLRRLSFKALGVLRWIILPFLGRGVKVQIGHNVVLLLLVLPNLGIKTKINLGLTIVTKSRLVSMRTLRALESLPFQISSWGFHIVLHRLKWILISRS